ncbi:MAG: hypothetical protein WDZ64_00855 [Parcubacteria group bacterium]
MQCIKNIGGNTLEALKETKSRVALAFLKDAVRHDYGWPLGSEAIKEIKRRAKRAGVSEEDAIKACQELGRELNNELIDRR